MSKHTTGLLAQLEERFTTLTPTGKRIANYLLANPEHLPFATADSIAQQAGTTGVTVGRFLRSLGYRNFEDVKASLRGGSTWLMTDRLGAFRHHNDHGDGLDRSLASELEAIKHVYALARTPVFATIVEHLAEAEVVFIVGLQLTRGIATVLSSHLEFIRPKVFFVDGLSGTFAESLNSGFDRPYVLFADTRAYSSTTRKYCEQAKELGIPMALITDYHCTWARDYTVDLLQVKMDVGQFWDSLSPLACLFNLMVSGVVERNSEHLESRLKNNKHLQQVFGQFEL